MPSEWGQIALSQPHAPLCTWVRGCRGQELIQAWAHLALILSPDGGPSAAWAQGLWVVQASPLVQVHRPSFSPQNYNFRAGWDRTRRQLGREGGQEMLDGRLNPSPLGAPLNLEIN